MFNARIGLFYTVITKSLSLRPSFLSKRELPDFGTMIGKMPSFAQNVNNIINKIHFSSKNVKN